MEKDMRTICRRNCGLCRRSEIAQYVSEPGFSIKQLRDYVENWIGLIRANEHLKESIAIKQIKVHKKHDEND